MLILDANVILRYLLRDIPNMAEEARAAIMAGYRHMEGLDAMTFDRKLRKAFASDALAEGES